MLAIWAVWHQELLHCLRLISMDRYPLLKQWRNECAVNQHEDKEIWSINIGHKGNNYCDNSKQEKETTSSGLNKTTNCNKVATTKITLEEKHATLYHMPLCSQHTFKFKNSVSAYVKIMCHAISSQQTELKIYSVSWPLHRCKSWHSEVIDLDEGATLKTSAFT